MYIVFFKDSFSVYYICFVIDFLGMIGVDDFSGMIFSRLFQFSMISFACFFISFFRLMDIFFFIVIGLLICLEMLNNLVLRFFFFLKLVNYFFLRLQIIGVIAIVLILVIVVGYLKIFILVGNGGLRRGLSVLFFNDSIRDCKLNNICIFI